MLTVTLWPIAFATSTAARMEHWPPLSAHTPLAGLVASVSFAVFTVNVASGGGKVRGCSGRNERSALVLSTPLADLAAPAGAAPSAMASGAANTERLKMPPSTARARTEEVDIGGHHLSLIAPTCDASDSSDSAAAPP